MTNPLKLEVGKTYFDRRGREVCIRNENFSPDPNGIFRFQADDGDTYRVDGSALGMREHIKDLIAEKPAMPTIKLTPDEIIADELREALEARLETPPGGES